MSESNYHHPGLDLVADGMQNPLNYNRKLNKQKRKLRRAVRWFVFGSIIWIIIIVLLVIFFGGGVALTEQEDCSTDDNSATTTATSKIGKITVKDSSAYLTRIKNIANAVGPKVGVKPRLLFAQMYTEAGAQGNQPANIKDHNYGGMTWTAGCGWPKGTQRAEGGYYRHYKNISEFASDWAVTLKSYFSKYGYPKTISEYFTVMVKGGYMTDSRYYRQTMQAGYAKWTGKSTLSGALTTADNASVDTGEDCDTDGAGGGDVVKEARKWLGKFTYGYSRTALINWRHPSASDTCECAGFVWFVFKRVGYKVPSRQAGWWYTKSMETDARGPHNWLKRVSASNTRAGDVIIANTANGAGDNGHTAILLSKYHGGSTKVIEMGGDRYHDHVKIRTISYSFGSLMNGTVTFARSVSAGKANKSSGKLSSSEKAAKEWIAQRESSGSYKAVNSSSGTYGRYQLKPEYLAKGSSLGGDGTRSKANQEKVADNYVKGRYGSWVNAKKFWVAHHWY